MSMLAPKRTQPKLPSHQDLMFQTVLRWVVAAIFFSLIAWRIGGYMQEAQAQLPPTAASESDYTPAILTQSSYLVMSVPQPAITVGWNPLLGAAGYVLRWGIASNDFTWSVDTGTATNVTLSLAGGFEYGFAVQFYIRVATTNFPFSVKLYRPLSAEICTNAPCPQGEPQLLTTNGVWLVMCQAAGGGALQGSPDLVNWSTIGNIPTNAPALFQGPVIGNQFFRIKL